jgi:FkbM family methyltransferase
MRYLNLVKNISNWQDHVRYKLGLETSDPIVFRTRSGVQFEVPKRLYHEFKEIFFENAYVVGQQRELEEPDPVIIDIGANVGFFSIFMLSRYANSTLYAYEPVDTNFRHLQRNRNLNPGRNLNCFRAAVSDHRGAISLQLDPVDQFTTSATTIHRTDASLSLVEVPCIGLNDIFTDNGIERCHLLKLDCEGSEYKILYGAGTECLARIDRMVIEVHQGQHERENLGSLRDFLAAEGFDLFQIKGKPHMLWAHRSRREREPSAARLGGRTSGVTGDARARINHAANR